MLDFESEAVGLGDDTVGMLADNIEHIGITIRRWDAIERFVSYRHVVLPRQGYTIAHHFCL